MDPYATHQQALVRVALRTHGPILELGCGDYSTPILAEIAAATGRDYLMQASDMEWARRYFDIPGMRFDQVEWERWVPPIPAPSLDWAAQEWGFVLLDSEESTAGRIERLPALLAVTDTVVMHDADPAMSRARWPICSKGWRVEQLLKRYTPWTAILVREPAR